VVWLQNHSDGFSSVWAHSEGFSSVWALKPNATVCQWFDLKTTGTVFSGLASKLVVMVFGGLASKPAVTVSDSLASKPTVMVSLSLTSKPVAMVFCVLASKPAVIASGGLGSKLVVGFLVEPQNQGGGGFPSLRLKTGSYGLVIWASKSPRRFLGLGLKTIQASVCQLRHKTNGGRPVRDTHRDLAACFAWKQVWLGFSSLA
jgi:hypothetical protein